MRQISSKTLLLGIFALFGIVIIAQLDECPAIVETALDSIDSICADTGRNQACYGNVSIETEFQADVTDIMFVETGDIIDVGHIRWMQLSPMNEAEGRWGLAMMRLQANIPDTTPGQNVTFLLFGDVEITDASDDFADTDLNPMQAFYLKTGIGDADCAEAPESGLLVQTPDGIDEVAFNVNGVDIAMGSTILFQAEANSEMTVSAMEGAAMMELEGDIHTAIAGMELRIPIDEHFRPTGPPPPPEAYREDTMRRVPSARMQRPIQPPPPMSDEQVAQAQEMIRNGQPPCGMEGFPDCDRLPMGGLRQGPGCLNQQDNCRERLAPHEGMGILPPEHYPTPLNQPTWGQPTQNQLSQNQPPQGQTPPSQPLQNQPPQGQTPSGQPPKGRP